MAVALGVAANTALDVPSLASLPVPAGLGADVDQLIETAVAPEARSRGPGRDARRAPRTGRGRAEGLNSYPTVGVSTAYGEQAWGYRFDGTPSVRTAQPCNMQALLTINWDLFTGFKRLNGRPPGRGRARRRSARNFKSLAEVDADRSLLSGARITNSRPRPVSRYEGVCQGPALCVAGESYDANLDTLPAGAQHHRRVADPPIAISPTPATR